jgi:probable F420-dependent oxidoreductase
LKTGVLFPTTEIGTDPIAIRDYAQAAESLGYDHMLFFEHVVGANAESPLGRDKPWRHTNMYHEPFVLFGYLAAATTSIELATCIMVLPMRETALVAKQAAAVDVLTGGRLRLGVGVGMNTLEYKAMGKEFGDRGSRTDEQIEVLRLLWTKELVTYEGRWHKITDAGINPLPIQRPIPLWIGGSADPVLRRIGRLGDGWMLPGGIQQPDEAMRVLARIHDHARAAGRDPAEIGVQKVISGDGPDEWADGIRAWSKVGVTHFAVSAGVAASPDGHIEKMRRFREVADAV